MRILKEVVEAYQSILDLHSNHFDIGVFWREDENWKVDTFITNRDEWVLRKIAKIDKNAVVLHNSEYIDIYDSDILTSYIIRDVPYYYNENNKDKSHNIYTFLEKEYPAKNTTIETEKKSDNMENSKQQQSMTRNDVIKIMEKELQALSEYNTVVDVPEDKCRTSEVMLEIAKFLVEVKK